MKTKTQADYQRDAGGHEAVRRRAPHVEEAGRAVLTQTTADEPITLILSEKGWIRSRAGHNLDLSQTAFKEGDRLKQTLEGRTVLPVVILDSLGRTYTLDAAEIPGGRGDGVPVSSLIELQNGAKPVAMLTGQPEQHYLLSGSGGYGFITKLGDMVGRVKAGKVVMTVDSGETVLPPIAVYASSLINPDCKIVLASSDHRLLAFSIGELKVMPKGARFAVDVADRRRIAGTRSRNHGCGIHR